MSLIMVNAASAATIIDLRHQPVNYLQRNATHLQLKQSRTEVDFNHIAHIHLQQMYAGVPVWDATGIVHTPKTDNHTLSSLNSRSTLNGKMYGGLEKDLGSTPSYALTDSQKDKAKSVAKAYFLNKTGHHYSQYQEESVKTIVYVDPQNVAHYSFLVSFLVDDGISGEHRPATIIDATTLTVYRQWDQVMTMEVVPVGGVGGNKKQDARGKEIGKLTYDGGTEPGHLPTLLMQRDEHPSYFTEPLCLLQNDDVVVKDVAWDSVSMVACPLDPTHGGLPWADPRVMRDAVNDAYSPSLDAFYAATIVKKLYQDWYGIPVLANENGSPMQLLMRVHYGRYFENAYWDGERMTFGDGEKMFYPLVSLDVSAHEISHGFTMQHSNIDVYELQMGALHESFSDIASAAAQFYTTGTNTWDLGRSISKGENALRYMNTPTKDGMSIDHMKDLNSLSYPDPHLAAGIFNKAFYLIATSRGWDTHKAFNVMVKANMDYWTSSMKTFDEAACGVVSATKDYNYSEADVKVAFTKVGIDISGC